MRNVFKNGSDQNVAVRNDKQKKICPFNSAFIASMSHNLRTPMIGILGFSEMLMTDLKDEEARAKAKMINDSGKRLMETLNTIMDLALVESGHSEIKLVVFNVIDIIKDQLRLFAETANEKNINLALDTFYLNISAKLDRDIFTKIIWNLLSNAIKFTEKGSVAVDVWIEDGKQKYLVIAVKDTGIGIPPDKQAHLFKPLDNMIEVMNRDYYKIGFGLTLTKKYVDMLNGTITCKSEPGEGSTFIVVLKIDYFESVERYSISSVRASIPRERLS
jgi:signal transduction histidine kinase